MKNSIFKISPYKKLLFVVLFVFTLFSCRKENVIINDPTNYSTYSAEDVFESFWHGLNNNYVFWDIDPTDWDEVYRKYKPLFQALDKNTDPSINRHEIVFGYIKEMTANLIDSHFYITSNFWGSEMIHPSKARIMKRANFHIPIDQSYFNNILSNQYLDPGFLTSENQNDDPYFSVAGTIQNKILYYHFSNFYLTKIQNEHTDADALSVLNFYLNQIKNNPNLEGLVLDLRGNGGGILSDMDILVGTLTDKPYVFAQLRYKAGNNRLDYTPWVDVKVKPSKELKAFNKPIVVLTDMHSISMAEMSTMALKQLPNAKVTVVGERTWGGVGPLINDLNRYFGGQFKNSYFSLVYTSSATLRYINGVNYEGVGFPPDIPMDINLSELNNGIDKQLEKAIEILNK